MNKADIDFLKKATTIAIAVAFGIWFVSELINVDFNTGATFLARAFIVLAPSLFLLWNDFATKMVLPVCLGGLAWSFFPVLDYWSLQSLPAVLRELSSNNDDEWYKPEWYARWYSETAFLFISMIVGYGVGKKCDGE